MYKKELVLGLKLISQLQIARIYENCIFGKIHIRLYNEEVVHEKKMLEQVYMDLWRLSLVVSDKKTKYFIILINSISTFRYVTNFIQLVSPQPVDRFSQTKLRWKAPNEGYPHTCGMYKSDNK